MERTTMDIAPILARYDMKFRRASTISLGNAGGMSGAAIWRIVVESENFALRRWPTVHPAPERLRWIHDVLRQASNRGIDVLPVPMETVDGETFIVHEGHLWELAPWMSGQADYESAPSTARLRSALTALARFHLATSDFRAPSGARLGGQVALSTGISRRVALLHALTEARIAELRGAIDRRHWPELAGLADEFLAIAPQARDRVLRQLMPLADIALALQPCLRDIWHDHVLFTGDEVTGLIDFGAMDIDTPSTDIARLLGSLVGDDAEKWQIGLGAYAAVRPLTDVERGVAKALDQAGVVLGACNWVKWVYCERRSFENQAQVTTRFARLVRRAKSMTLSHGS